jgi:hypothetical protein
MKRKLNTLMSESSGAASSSSNLPQPLSQPLSQSSSSANTATLLNSKDFNTLNTKKNDLLTKLDNNKDKLQQRAILSLQKQISTALRPVKLKNLQTDYFNKLEQAKEENHKLSLSELKALTFEKTYLVNVVFYTRNNPRQLDANNVPTNKKQVAFYNKLNEHARGSPYWMTDISDGVRQYTINTPADFDILDLVKRKIFKYHTILNHGKTFRVDYGENSLYTQMIEYFDTDYECMSWYGFIAEYLHVFQIMSVVELSNNEQIYNPLETDLMYSSKISITNKYIMTTLDTTKESFDEAIRPGNEKHYDNECIINAFIDHYEYTLMKDNKRHRLTREKIINMMGKTEKSFIKHGASIKDLEPVFITYRLKARMLDAFNKMIYKYDPPFHDHRAKSFYCMIQNNHIYVLNYDLKSLEQKQHDEGDKKRACASADLFLLKMKRMKTTNIVK